MTNKDWDKFHKEIYMDVEADKDTIKFLKRFYRDDKEYREVLDLGCGQGSNLAYISYTYKDWICYGVDYSAQGLLKVNHRLKHRDNVKLKQSDAKAIDYKDEKFDIIVDVALLASCDNYEEIIKEATRLLKPKGRIFIKELTDSECNKDNKYVRRSNVMRYKNQQLYDVLNSCGYEKIEVSNSRIEQQDIEHVICIGRKK